MKTTTYLRLTSLPIPKFVKKYLEMNFWSWAAKTTKREFKKKRKWKMELQKEIEALSKPTVVIIDEYPMVDTELKNGIFLEETGKHPERTPLAKDKIPNREMTFWADCLKLGG
jgi:hypothetical protein